MKLSVAQPYTHYPCSPETIPTRILHEGSYEARFARTSAELDTVLRLRFAVFNLELGEGLDSAYDDSRDVDEFDPYCHHLMIIDRENGAAVGSYRMQTGAMAQANRGFYSSTEFDLDSLPERVRSRAIELGRACIAAEHRSVQTLFLLWKGLALYRFANDSQYLFGCSSLAGQDHRQGATTLAWLRRHGHLHPTFRVSPQPGLECREEASETTAKPTIPLLFRTYLRYGAKVCGPPAIDRAFKTIDFFTLFDTEAMSPERLRTFAL